MTCVSGMPAATPCHADERESKCVTVRQGDRHTPCLAANPPDLSDFGPPCQAHRAAGGAPHGAFLSAVISFTSVERSLRHQQYGELSRFFPSPLSQMIRGGRAQAPLARCPLTGGGAANCQMRPVSALTAMAHRRVPGSRPITHHRSPTILRVKSNLMSVTAAVSRAARSPRPRAGRRRAQAPRTWRCRAGRAHRPPRAPRRRESRVSPW